MFRFVSPIASYVPTPRSFPHHVCVLAGGPLSNPITLFLLHHSPDCAPTLPDPILPAFFPNVRAGRRRLWLSPHLVDLPSVMVATAPALACRRTSSSSSHFAPNCVGQHQQPFSPAYVPSAASRPSFIAPRSPPPPV